MKLFIFILFFIVSCSNNYKSSNSCLNTDRFNIVLNGAINNLNKKYIINSIMNETNIKIDTNSNIVIDLNIRTDRNTSLISLNNIAEIENIRFTATYNIYDKQTNNVFDRGRFIIITSKDISDDRFVNYTTEEYIMNNFSKNLAIKLENKVNILIKNRACFN